MKKLHFRFFTLVELLVVITIFVLLISILQPSLKKMLASSESVSCATNLRQSMLGAIFYDEDHQWLPAPILEMQTTRLIPKWSTLWYNSLLNGGYTEGKNPKQGCPTEKLYDSADSYAINGMDLESNSVKKKMSPIRKVAFGYQISIHSTGDSTPDRLLFLADHQAKSNGWMHFAIRTSASFWDGTHRAAAPPDFRHFDLKNAAFVDGHVSAHGPGEFEDGLFLR